MQEAIRQARYNALKAANVELVNLYWQVGSFVSSQLKLSKWGEKTVQQLAIFLQKEDPELKGFDRKGIYRMVKFYESYYGSTIVPRLEMPIPNIENKPVEFVTSPRR